MRSSASTRAQTSLRRADVHALLATILTDVTPDGDRLCSLARDFDLDDASLWEQLPTAADYHGVCRLVEPVVLALCRSTGNPAALNARRIVSAIARRESDVCAARERCIDRLIAAFDAAGVRMVLLKGTALAHLIYMSPELRPMADIDILIDGDDAEAAIAIAKSAAFAFADKMASKFMGRWHHLPPAETTESGFRIVLEIHTDAMSPDQPCSLSMRTLADAPRPFARGAGPDGLALSHTDMLRHLTRHAFEPVDRVRLIHLYDIWRYQAVFHDQIDWQDIEDRFRSVLVVSQLVSQIFDRNAYRLGTGLGMRPLSNIAASNARTSAKLAELLAPPAWWLHGFYGIPAESSLFVCRSVHHPLTVGRWLLRRLAAGVSARNPTTSELHAGARPVELET
jgi:hypothetical protein